MENNKCFLSTWMGCNYISTSLGNNHFLKEIAELHPYKITNKDKVIWKRAKTLCFNNALRIIHVFVTNVVTHEEGNSYEFITQKDFSAVKAEVIKACKKANKDLPLTEMYKEDDKLNIFTHFHFYSSGKPHNDSIKKHQSFKVLGINIETGTYRWIVSKNIYRFDEIRTLESFKFIEQMGFWQDGSFFIKSFKLVKLPDIFNTFYIIEV